MRTVLMLGLPTLALIFGISWFAQSQTVRNPAPAGLACAYNSSPPTLTTGTFGLIQCDSTGQLKIAP